MVFVTRARANLRVLGFKISVLRQKLVIICSRPAGGNSGVIVVKISVLRKKKSKYFYQFRMLF